MCRPGRRIDTPPAPPRLEVSDCDSEQEQEQEQYQVDCTECDTDRHQDWLMQVKLTSDVDVRLNSMWFYLYYITSRI